MKPADGKTEPIWQTSKIPRFSSFNARSRADCDVCIVGAGIAGLTTAYLAAVDGHSVIVIDEGQPGGGQTGRTSAHLASALDDRFFKLEQLHGGPGMRLAYESHAAAIDTIERIASTEQIACEFHRLPGYLNLGQGDSADLLHKELDAARRAGVTDVEFLADGGWNDGPRLRFGNQARFEPMLYLAGLAKAVQKKGGKIYVGARVIEVQGSDPKSHSPAEVKHQGVEQPITAKHIVVATNTPSPINDWFGIYTKQASYRTYMIGAAIPQGAVEDALYWDTTDPYHYVRLLRSSDEVGDDILLIGGEDHKTGQFPEHGAPFLKLEEWARKHYPLGEVRFRWSGQVQEPSDGLAFLGRALTAKQEVYVITGDSGMGLTHGTIGAMIINDQIAGRPNPWENLYDPARKQVNTEFLSEVTNTVAQYKDLITPGEVKSKDDIPPGHGMVVRDGLKKIAVYRDSRGKLHQCSAVCTHLQCIVHWNHIEDTWDCPCHGSRFTPTGEVLMGPAVDNLSPISDS